MKKIVLILILFLFSFNFFSFFQPFASAEIIYWAKIEKTNVGFYALADEDSLLFMLPQSYFVKLTGEDENFFCAQYKDLLGFVKKQDVQAMDGTPQTPFYNEKFRVFLPAGTGLYATAELKQEYKIIDVPYLYSELSYYGSISGEAIPEKSNLWHYCKYKEDAGYVYSIFCDNLTSPPLNTETFATIENVSFAENAPLTLSSTAMAFIIIGVALPCLIVLYLLVKPNMSKAVLPKEKNKYKARKRKDYFEFDQSDLG